MRKLVCKEDWDGFIRRWTAFWNNDVYERPVLQFYAPKKDKEMDPEIVKAEMNPKTKWADYNHIIRREKEKIRNTYFAAESLPFVNPGWSVGHTAFLGCEPNFQEGTVWIEPMVTAEEEYPEIRFREDGFWWNWFREANQKFAAECEGDYYLLPCLGNNATDTLAMLRGSEQFMIDIVENPKWVKEAVKKVSDILIDISQIAWKDVELSNMEGYANYGFMWAPGRTAGFDCDMCLMVSPKQFQELFLLPLVETMHTVDYRFYHLDGEGSLKHLDTLLSISELQGFHFIPDKPTFGINDWIDLVKRIQKRKKSLQVFIPNDQVIPLLKEVRPEGLAISTWFNTPEDADKMVEEVAKLYK